MAWIAYHNNKAVIDSRSKYYNDHVDMPTRRIAKLEYIY